MNKNTSKESQNRTNKNSENNLEFANEIDGGGISKNSGKNSSKSTQKSSQRNTQKETD